MDPIVVKGEGPVPCRIAIVGEAPGPDENRARRPFVGRSGKLLTHYLTQAGIPWDEVWISNVYPFWPGPGNPAPTEAEIREWEHVLINDLVKVKPTYILALGAVAASWFLNRAVNMEKEHGLTYSAEGEVDQLRIQVLAEGENVGRMLDVESNHRHAGVRPDSSLATNHTSKGSSSSAGAVWDQANPRLGRGSLVPQQAVHATRPHGAGDAGRELKALPSVDKGERWQGGQVRLVTIAFHPAAGLHNPRVANYCVQDIQRFAEAVKGKWSPAIDQHAGNTNYRFISRKDFGTFSKLNLPAVDTEGTPDAPFCVSVSASTGAAGVFDADNVTRHRNDFQHMMERSGPVLFHNSLWDFAVLRAMLLNTDTITVIDTRVMAYLLQEASQGLKELAYRYCGMEMQTYEEVAGPPSIYKAVSYLRRAAKLDLPAAVEVPVRDPKTRRWRVSKPHSIGTRIKALLTSIKKETCDPWERWEGIDHGLRRPVEAHLGPIPPLSLANAPQESWTEYAGRDPDATRRLYHALAPRIKEQGLEEVLALDCAVLPMFEAMQARGIRLDVAHLTRMRPAVVQQLQLKERAFSKRWLKGKPISLNSDDQVARFLYGELKLPLIRTTAVKGRGSMDDDTLRLLVDKHPAVRDVLEYAKLSTHLSFLDRLPKWVQPDGRLHPTILITQTVTGRPATKDPNLLNIPVRTPEGREMRNAFCAAEGMTLVEIDLSQIELRMMAHLSGDKRMMQAYQDNADLHQITADGNKLSRALAKTVNFALLYLCTGYKLMMVFALEGVSITEEEGDAIIEGWYSLYPGVRAYQQRVMREARATGMVRTLSGRARSLPLARLPEGDPLRAEAERHAVNMPVQGGAADVIKWGMRRIWKWIIQNRDEGVHPLLQIYDSLLFEVPEGKEDVAVLFKRMMTRGFQLRVPLDAEAKIGTRWGSLEKVK